MVSSDPIRRSEWTWFVFRDVDGVLRRANATEFGLASGVITRDLSKALYVTEKLQAGTVFVNTYNKTDVAAPFGGFKQSGFGKDLGNDSLPAVRGTAFSSFHSRSPSLAVLKEAFLHFVLASSFWPFGILFVAIFRYKIIIWVEKKMASIGIFFLIIWCLVYGHLSL